VRRVGQRLDMRFAGQQRQCPGERQCEQEAAAAAPVSAFGVTDGRQPAAPRSVVVARRPCTAVADGAFL